MQPRSLECAVHSRICGAMRIWCCHCADTGWSSAVPWAMGSGCQYRWSFPSSPAARPVPNRPQTSTGWGLLLWTVCTPFFPLLVSERIQPVATEGLTLCWFPSHLRLRPPGLENLESLLNALTSPPAADSSLPFCGLSSLGWLTYITDSCSLESP